MRSVYFLSFVMDIFNAYYETSWLRRLLTLKIDVLTFSEIIMKLMNI